MTGPVPFSSALVTGASGFLGSWLCRILAERGVAVTALLRRAPPPDGPFARFGLEEKVDGLVRPDGLPTLADLADRMAEGAGVVFHLAGLSQAGEAARDPARAFEVNARGTWQLLDRLLQAGWPGVTVLASTEAVYGDAGARPSQEGDPLRPQGAYALSKVAAESAALAFAAAGLPVAIARIGNVYGPGDPNAARLVPSICHAAARGEPPLLRSAQSVRGYLHVRDCVDGLVALAALPPETARGRIVNIVSEAPVTNHDLAMIALDLAGLPDLRPQLAAGGGEAGTPADQRLSSARLARDLLQWNAIVPLQEGLREIIEVDRL